MTTDSTPEEIRNAAFRTAFRGFDQTEVTAFLEAVAASLERLTDQNSRLTARLGEFAERDLRSEFESVGREVATVLESARSAAESMRDRASAEATRWRAEAAAESETLKKEARADAESLRTDAWTTASQLLDQVVAEVERMRTEAERGSLATLGGAEREGHRLTSAARRESEDLLRSARMEAEKLVADAKSDHEEIITTAHRLAEAAQERTRALEQRREELMDELESVRSALSSFETELEDRRAGIGMSTAPPLPRQVVVADERGGEPHVETWEEGHTVRVIRPSRPESSEEETPESDQPEAEAFEDDTDEFEFEADDFDDLEPNEPESEPEPAEAEEETPEPPGEPEPEDEPEPEPQPDLVSALFQRLRAPDEPEPDLAPSPTEPDQTEGKAEPAVAEPEPAPAEDDDPGEDDPFDTRDRLLLPVTNTALRAVKRTLTEAQNEALDQIRSRQGEWLPDAAALGDGLRADLESLVADAAEAGREAATELGVGGGAGGDPEQVEIDTVAEELAQALDAALASAGSGARERSAAASRVFRGWRTDEAERRVRWVAMTSYHSALRSALEANDLNWGWRASGRPCPTCRSAAEAADSAPPAHRGCTCTIVPI